MCRDQFESPAVLLSYLPLGSSFQVPTLPSATSASRGLCSFPVGSRVARLCCVMRRRNCPCRQYPTDCFDDFCTNIHKTMYLKLLKLFLCTLNCIVKQFCLQFSEFPLLGSYSILDLWNCCCVGLWGTEGQLNWQELTAGSGYAAVERRFPRRATPRCWLRAGVNPAVSWTGSFRYTLLLKHF